MDQNLSFKDKSILITGGTGSFGRAFAKKLILEGSCKKVIIFSRDEWKQGEMRDSDPVYSHAKMRYFLGDVRDAKRLHRAFQEVDLVVHAAALKQVPAAEYNPTEFIQTNIVGAMNVIDACIDCGVKKVMALSTDKAVNPINMYGATKLCQDKLMVAANAYVGARGFPTFSVVRYGNVAASRGSLIPFWKKLLNEGATTLPITDERMTRFWISLEEAVDFVIKCLSNAYGGEIFIPKIPSFKVTELAKVMNPGGKINPVGIRAGEKLHELMFSSDDARHTFDAGDYYVIAPETHALTKKIKGPLVEEGFAYTSDTNTKWLEGESLKARLDQALEEAIFH